MCFTNIIHNKVSQLHVFLPFTCRSQATATFNWFVYCFFFISLRLRFYDSRWVRAAAHLISLLQLFYFNFNKKGEKLKFGNKKERTWNGQQPAKKSVQSIPRILFIESSTPCLGVHMCVIPILCWTKSSKNLCFINNTFRSNCRRGEKINWNTSSIKSKRTFNFTSPQTRKSEEFLNKQLFSPCEGNETNQFVFNY